MLKMADMTSSKLKWGILGTGSIARVFTREVSKSRTGTPVAVGSRTVETAEKFASEFNLPTAHGSYEALLADQEVDAVYISTPHPMHAEWAIKAAEAGKHILCEKPLAMNYAEASAIIGAARQHNVFLMEAFMYRCHPQTAKLIGLIRDKVIGDVRLIRATYSFSKKQDLKTRLLNPNLGGGGILDVGCYCVSMARLIAGIASGRPFEDPLTVEAVGHIGAESGVDEYAIASLKFPDGILAQLAAGLQLKLENNVSIIGTKGSILVPSPWSMNSETGFSKIIVFNEGVPDEIVIESDRGIYEIEADTVANHIAERQALAMTWGDSLGNMRTLDRWREKIGLVYPSEKRQC